VHLCNTLCRYRDILLEQLSPWPALSALLHAHLAAHLCAADVASIPNELRPKVCFIPPLHATPHA
jgi:hypothetical protein